jgi:putative transposase
MPGGYCYHVLSRGNGRQEVFHKAGDYEAFVRLFDAAHAIVPMRILAYCLMPNHFHLVLWPVGDGDVSRWMQWLLTTGRKRGQA